jgi:hypothetical protein
VGELGLSDEALALFFGGNAERCVRAGPRCPSRPSHHDGEHQPVRRAALTPHTRGKLLVILSLAVGRQLRRDDAIAHAQQVSRIGLARATLRCR